MGKYRKWVKDFAHDVFKLLKPSKKKGKYRQWVREYAPDVDKMLRGKK